MDPDPETAYYKHSGSANPNSSESNSEDERQADNSYDTTMQSRYYTYDSYGQDAQREYYHYNLHNTLEAEGEFLLRSMQTQGSEEEEDAKEPTKDMTDPGPFRYNKRVFITALPCLLLTFVICGETLLLMVSIGGMIIALMAQMGEDVSKRCVVVFTLLFIPCHILIVGTVLPLIWLSRYNLFLILLINLFFIMTGGWVILQFVAFRKEESAMCAIIEQMLFSLYPFVCCALVTWVLSTVVMKAMLPFIFILIWFVCLQLYLMPAASSFKLTETVDEDLNVLQQPIIVAIVATFIISGPALHFVLTLLGMPFMELFSLSFLSLLSMLTFLGLFLCTLLSIRQLAEYLGLPHLLMVRVRWVSGVGVLLLCYPVLQQLGIVSHFLLSLPLVVGVFTALALMLSLKKPKVLSLLLMAGLTLLMCLWMSYLPWGLVYYFLGVLPLRAFYALVASNFVLCILVIFAAWHNSKEILGLLLLLQATGLTVCEVGLYQAGLYPLPTFQLTGIMAAYMLHRLYLADKLTRNTAAFASAVQLTKTAITALGYLLQEGMMIRDKRVVEISAADFLTLLAFVGVVVWIFVYETKEEVSLFESGKHVGLLMLCLGVSARSFLVPVGRLLLQDDPTLADLVGLWYGLSSVLVLLYALQHSGSASVMEQLMRVAIVLGAVGALVMVMQPQFVFTLYALYQWSEVLSILLLAAILATGVTVSFFQTLVTAAVLGVCPGVHAALLLYEQEATVLHLSLVAALTCTLLAFFIIIVKTQEVSDTAENFFKIGTVTAVVLLAAVMAVDLINLEARSSLWTYPCWRVALGVMAIVALALKMLAVKLGPQHLPLTKREDHGLPLIPLIGNMATVATFLLACTQGPEDGLLHDLWCSASALFLVFLQRDSLLLSSLSPSNRGTPTVVAAIMALVLSTIWRSRLWLFNGIFSTIVGFLEIVSVFASLPVYIVLAGIMWRGEIWSEKAVVFTLPMNALLVLLGTSFTSWALCVAGAVCGIGMMMFKLPLLPYNCQIMQR